MTRRQWVGVLAVLLLGGSVAVTVGMYQRAQDELEAALELARGWRDAALVFDAAADTAADDLAACKVALGKAIKMLPPIGRPNTPSETGRSSGNKAGRPAGPPRSVPPQSTVPPSWRSGRPWA